MRFGGLSSHVFDDELEVKVDSFPQFLLQKIEILAQK